jgi:hypothetical protein
MPISESIWQGGRSFDEVSNPEEWRFISLRIWNSLFKIIFDHSSIKINTQKCFVTTDKKNDILESFRNFVKFIDSICRKNKLPGFTWMNSIFTNIANRIHRLPVGSIVNISDTVWSICTFQAKAVVRSMIEKHSFPAQLEVTKIPRLTFHFDGSINPKYVPDALDNFIAQCNAFYDGLLEEIPDKATVLKNDICEKVFAEWRL